MYIGPWQEYSLSKARESNRVNAQLRPGIEQALLNSLDPEVAKKALEAMMPYFEKPTLPVHPRESSNNFNSTTGKRRRTVRTLPALHSSINSPLAISARERSLQAASPLSVRSTQSEPIRYNYGIGAGAGAERDAGTPASLPRETAQFNSTSNHASYLSQSAQMPLPNVVPNRQPIYDSHAAANLLRLERQAKARSEIAKITGWKVDPSVTSSAATEQRTKAKEPAPTIVEDKMSRVNALKGMYMASKQQEGSEEGHFLPPLPRGGQPNASALTLSNVARHNNIEKAYNGSTGISSGAVPLPSIAGAVPQRPEPALPIIEEDAIKTPRVGDVELTDEAFSLVSKYFQSASSWRSTSPPAEEPLPVKALGIAAVPSSSGAGATTTDRYVWASGGAAASVGIKGTAGAVGTPSQGGALSRSSLQLLRQSGIETPMNDDLESEVTSTVGAHGTGATGRDDLASPYAPGEDLFPGGIEGLLMWSSQLELDTS